MLAAFSASLVHPWTVKGQVYTDNFDSYANLSALIAAGWQYVPASGGITVSFPAQGSGKATRFQTPNGSLVSIFRTNIYTDFYIAADVVNWNNITDQAIILEARATNQAGVAATKDYTMNFDVVQDGDGPGDRKGGQLQIIRVDSVSPLVLGGIAVSEVSLVPGNGYRFIFKGVGTELTGQVYDLNDLTRPMITVHGSDSTYADGVSGIGVFDRDTAGAATGTDVTYDNYYAGPTDPNTAIAPAIKHSIVGTPQVITRTPTNRFTNFHPPASGINFSVATFTTNIINTSATKLYLNEADVSASLAPLPANGTNASFSTTAGTLKSNIIYSARIEVQDVSGTQKSTNTFWFDTFSDSYLSSGTVKTIEAEEYNYSNGVYQLDPIAVSGFTTNNVMVNGNGVGYLDLLGTTRIGGSTNPLESVDYYDNRTSGESPWTLEFRKDDTVGLSQGMYREIEDSNDPLGDIRYSDNVRSKYAASNLLEFVVHRTEPGEWLNYTRSFISNKYFAYLRVASLGSTTVNFEKVTSNPTTTNQTTVLLSTFSIPNNMTRYNYTYIPAKDGLGARSVLDLSGTNTLRLTMSGTPVKDNRLMAINYILLVPVGAVQLLSSSTVTGPYTVDGTATVNTSTQTITIPTSGAARFYRLAANDALTIKSISVSGGTVTIKY